MERLFLTWCLKTDHKPIFWKRILTTLWRSRDSLLRTSRADRVLILQCSGLKIWLPCFFVLRESKVKYFQGPIFVNFIRPFARWCHLMTTTRILFLFLSILKIWLEIPARLTKALICTRRQKTLKDSGRSSKMTSSCKWPYKINKNRPLKILNFAFTEYEKTR